MALLPYHIDNPLSDSQCLSGDQKENIAEERNENFFPPLFNDKTEGNPRKPRMIIIREELVDLTNSLLASAILGQMLYWCQKVPDFDLYIEEEKADPLKCPSSFQYGWFYKSSRELMGETMVRVTLATFRRYMGFLKSRGWIQTRRNPENKLDPKVHYRVNLRKLCIDLHKKGHSLSGLQDDGTQMVSPSIINRPIKRSKEEESK